METPYRQSLINMLRPECTDIQAPVEVLKREIASLNCALQKRARLHIYWLGAFASFILFVVLSWIDVSTFAALVASFFPICLAHIIAPQRFSKTFIGYISRRQEFTNLHDAIQRNALEIERLISQAKRYQIKMEPEGTPGLLAIYSEIINKPYFKSSVPRQDRSSAVSLSIKGKGHEIDIMLYGAVLKSLKQFDFERYIKSKTLVGIDFLRAGSRSSIAIQCTYLIAEHVLGNSKPSPETVKKAIIIGKNAFLSASDPGLPSSQSTPQSKIFSCAGRFLGSLNKNHISTNALATEYLCLFQRAITLDKTLANLIPDIPEIA